MKRVIAATVLLCILASGMISCGGTSTSDLNRMLEYIPASTLETEIMCYGDPLGARTVYGYGDISFEEYVEVIKGLSDEASRGPNMALGAAYVPAFTGNMDKLADVIGWSRADISRAIFHDVPMPRVFAVNEGNFDAALIRQNLLDQGYEETKYGDYTYLWKNDDFKIDLTDEIGREVTASLNRVMVTEDLLITAPATDIMTGLLDAMSGDTKNAADMPSCRALAETLEDSLSVVFIPREAALSPSPHQTLYNHFNLSSARDWEPLHLYEMAALAYRDDGEERSMDVCLYYDNKSDAEADGDNLAARLESYVFFTFNDAEDIPLADIYDVGEPVVREYEKGATLTVSCRYQDDYEGRHRLIPYLIQGMYDVLFLAPDPAEYVVNTTEGIE